MKEILNKEYSFLGERYSIGGTIAAFIGTLVFLAMLGIAGNIDRM